MVRPLRTEQFSPEEVGIVHCVQRCVRRAFLAGLDPVSGKDFEFRREWIRRRLEALASAFGCDVLTYAVMSNHLHVILRNRPDVVAEWSDEEAAMRWLKVFPGKRIDEHLGQPTDQDIETLVNDRERLAEIRRRLADISWFMRALSEPIARMANKQDECTGRFWEGRFKAQRLTDEAGLLACAMYVDLNPVRAAMVASPDEAKHTSAYDRIRGERGQEVESAAYDLVPMTREEAADQLESGRKPSPLVASRPSQNSSLRSEREGDLKPAQVARFTKSEKRRIKAQSGGRRPKRIRRDAWLAPLRLSPRSTSEKPQISRSGVRASDKGFLCMTLKEYLGLLRWTSRSSPLPGLNQEAKVPPRLQGVLSRLGIDASMWRDLVWNYKRYFGQSRVAGSPESMSQHAQESGGSWARGQAAVRECFV